MMNRKMPDGKSIPDVRISDPDGARVFARQKSSVNRVVTDTKSQPGVWRLWLRESHEAIRERLGYDALREINLLGPYHSADRSEIDLRVAWLAERGVTTEAELVWLPPAGEQPIRLGDEIANGSSLRITGMALRQYAEAIDEVMTASECRERATELLMTAHRISGEPDPRDTYGHPVRYRARSRSRGIDATALVAFANGVYTVEDIACEGYGRRPTTVARRGASEG